MKSLRFAIALAVLTGVVAAQTDVIFPEVEPNDSKLAANLSNFFTLAPGDSITGTCTGTLATGLITSFDYFRVRTTAMAAGIYQNTLTLTETPPITVFHTMTLRGLDQSAGVAGTVDSTVQSALAVGMTRVCKWNTFGPAADMYVRIAGTTTSTGTYTLTLTTSPVVPIAGPTGLNAGSITIQTVGETTLNTDTWVYDGTYTAMPGYGNDDEPAPGTTLQSKLTRTYAPGTYYYAIHRSNAGSNLVSPLDDRNLAGFLLDFPGNHLTNYNMAGGVCNSRFIACTSNTLIAATAAAQAVVWISFTVVPATGLAWQTNYLGVWDVNINGVQNTPLAPASVAVSVNEIWSLNINTVGVPGHDIAYSLLPGTGGIPTPGGQVVNIDLCDTGLCCPPGTGGFFYNLSFLPAPSSYSFNFSLPIPYLNISIQGLAIDPSHQEGLRLSELTQLAVN